MGLPCWGEREAQQWVRQLRGAVSKQLSIMPKGFPLAQEDDAFFEEIRQMAVGRYRLLFTVKGRRIHVLHLRGACVGGPDQPES